MSEHSPFNAHDRGDYMTAREAAAAYGCTPEYIARLCREGQLLGHLEGRVWQVSSSDLVRLAAQKGKARMIQARRLSRERRKEYEASVDHTALYSAIFETVAALPRKKAPLDAAPKRRPLHRRAAVERAMALSIAIVAIFGNYALVSTYGAPLAAEARSFSKIAYRVAIESVSIFREDDVMYEQAVSGMRQAVAAAYTAVSGTRRAGDAPMEVQALPRPSTAPPPREVSEDPGVDQVIEAKVLRAEELCVGGVCLTEETLRELTESI